MGNVKHIVLGWLLVVAIAIGFGATNYFTDAKIDIKVCMEDSADDQQADQQELKHFNDLFFHYNLPVNLSNANLLVTKLATNQSMAIPTWWHSPLTPPPDLG